MKNSITDKGSFFRTRRFQLSDSDESQSIYYMAVCEGGGNFSVYRVISSSTKQRDLFLLKPNGGAFSSVNRVEKEMSTRDAIKYVASKEQSFLSCKTQKCLETNRHNIGSWHFLNHAKHVDMYMSETGVNLHLFTISFDDKIMPTLNSQPILLKHLSETIQSPIFSQNGKDLPLMTHVYAFPDGIRYARAKKADEGWNVTEVHRLLSNSPASAKRFEKTIELAGQADYETAIKALSKWENIQQIMNADLFGPNDFKDKEKAQQQFLALGTNYFRTHAEKEGFVFDLHGLPHKTIGGLVVTEGLFSVFQPETPQTHYIEKLLSHLEGDCNHNISISVTSEEFQQPKPEPEKNAIDDKDIALYLDNLLTRTPAITFTPDPNEGLGESLMRKFKDITGNLKNDREEIESARKMVLQVEKHLAESAAEIEAMKKSSIAEIEAMKKSGIAEIEAKRAAARKETEAEREAARKEIEAAKRIAQQEIQQSLEESSIVKKAKKQAESIKKSAHNEIIKEKKICEKEIKREWKKAGNNPKASKEMMLLRHAIELLSENPSYRSHSAAEIGRHIDKIDFYVNVDEAIHDYLRGNS